MSFKFSCVVLVKLENFIVLCGSANLSKTLHINFYQSRSSIVEVMIKKLFFFYASQCSAGGGWLLPGGIPDGDGGHCHRTVKSRRQSDYQTSSWPAGCRAAAGTSWNWTWPRPTSRRLLMTTTPCWLPTPACDTSDTLANSPTCNSTLVNK